MPPTNAPDRIRTPRLIGHRVTMADLDYLIKSDSDFRVQRWLFGKVSTPDESRGRLGRWMRMWEDDGYGFWIFENSNGEAVGHGGIFASPRAPGENEVGYALDPDFWGMGFATEITQASLRVGFEILRLDHIIGVAQENNIASRRVMEKSGMQLEAIVPSADGVAGARYAISHQQWHNVQKETGGIRRP